MSCWEKTGNTASPVVKPQTTSRVTHSAVPVAVIAGDGIGPDVIDAAIPAIERAATADGAHISWHRFPYGADHYLATGVTLPEGAVDRLRSDFAAILVGALGDPRVPGNEHARDILLGLRCELDLYINFRPCRLLHPSLSPLKNPPHRAVDLAIFRENTEGIYFGRGSVRFEGTDHEEHVAEDVHTVSKVRRITDAAFAWAQANGRRRVTVCDKSNAVPAHVIWQRVFNQVGDEYPDIEREHRYVDALAMELIREPERFDVIVTNNLFGDILSDIGAQLVGGLGMAPSANMHPERVGLFEPVHGSAPTLAGRGIANPMATILTGALMLRSLGLPTGAGLLEAAVRAALESGIRTPDIRGDLTTAQVGDWIAHWIEARSGANS